MFIIISSSFFCEINLFLLIFLILCSKSNFIFEFDFSSILFSGLNLDIMSLFSFEFFLGRPRLMSVFLSFFFILDLLFLLERLMLYFISILLLQLLNFSWIIFSLSFSSLIFSSLDFLSGLSKCGNAFISFSWSSSSDKGIILLLLCSFKEE